MTEKSPEQPHASTATMIPTYITLIVFIIAIPFVYTAFQVNLRFSEVEADYEEARKLFHTSPHQALELVTRTIEATGNNYPQAQLLQSRLLLKLNRPEEALGALSLIEPQSKLASEELFLLAEEAQSKQVPLLAIHALKRAGTDLNAGTIALDKLVQLYRQLGQWNNAQQFSQMLLQEDPNNTNANAVMGYYYYQQKQLDKAEEALRTSVANATDKDQKRESALMLSEVLMDLGKLEEAETQLNQLQAEGDPHVQVELKAAKLLQRQGQTEAAWERLSSIQNITEAEIGDYLLLRGLILFDLDRDTDAATSFTELLKRQPWNYQAHNVLALTYRRLGQTERANQHQKQASFYRNKSFELLETTNEYRANPEDQQTRQKLIELYQLLGRNREAEALMRQ